MPSRSRSTHDTPQPVKLVPSAEAKAGRASSNARPVRARCGRRRAAARGSSSRRGRRARRRCSRRRRCPCRRSGRRRPRLRRARRSGSRARPAFACLPARDVQVEPVRVEVVCDVEVEAAVAVDVGEHRAEAVVERGSLEPGLARRPRGTSGGRSRPGPVEVEEVARRRRGWPGTLPPSPGSRRSGRCSRPRTGRAARRRSRRRPRRPHASRMRRSRQLARPP